MASLFLIRPYSEWLEKTTRMTNNLRHLRSSGLTIYAQ